MQLIRHRIFDELRADIMSCELEPGSELRESELALKYGVSKSPIRDALQKLEFEGLVEIEPRQGHRVIPISIKDARDILELREVLEAAAVRKIATDATEVELHSLNAYREAETTSLKSFTRYNRNFHTHLCRLSGNARQSDVMRTLMDNYKRLCMVSLSTRGSEIDAMIAALDDHNQIIDALQARDRRSAARLATKHIRRSHTQIMRGLQSQRVVR